ncbi:TetR/AcrR family transcriptional regulator [Kribbella sp. NPDC050124]|uniref:TetR/AcrR family transcriptional regulator n=1 Tax=Kribbella sp. NPDC050124 TaxID=3364114 RepID=UPI0037963B17
MPRVSQQYKDDQRGEILAAARRCFVRNGFHRTSMQDVFTEAGKSAGAVYGYFPTKDDLIIGVATQNLDDVTQLLRTALTRLEGERGVGQVMAELLEAVVERHQDKQLAPLALMVWSESLRNPGLIERLDDAAVSMSQTMAAFVRERQQEGAWTGAPAEMVARVILSILPGFLLKLALRGPDSVAGFPDAVRALWPR